MPSKRFFYSAAPVVILALAGMGLATAQSSSPFASKKRAQAWETPAQSPAQAYGQAQGQVQGQAWQQPAPARAYAAPNYAPQQQAYSAPPAYAPPAAAPQPALQPAPSRAAPSQVIPPSDAPISTRLTAREPAPVYRSLSSSKPPKTFSGQPQYGAPNLAGSTPPPPAAYNYNAPSPTRVAQAPDFGTAAPPTSAPPVPPQYRPPAPTAQPSSGSPFATRRPQAWEVPQPQQAPQYQAPQQPAPQYQQPAQSYNGGQYRPQTQAQSTPPQGVPPQNFPTQGVPPQNFPPQNFPPQGFPPQGRQVGGPFTPPPQQPRGWKERLGLGNLATMVRGAFTGGAAVSFRDTPDVDFSPDDGTSEDFIGDAELEVEVSAITQGGLEYGLLPAYGCGMFGTDAWPDVGSARPYVWILFNRRRYYARYSRQCRKRASVPALRLWRCDSRPRRWGGLSL